MVPYGLALYWRLVGATMRAQMQYKVSFVLMTLGAFAINIIDFAAIVVLFSHIPQLAGWSLGEVALLYGISGICFSTAELIGSALDSFERFVREGTFDRVLTRPLGAFFQVLAADLALRRFGRVAQGALVFVIAQRQLHLVWTLDRVAVMAMTLVSGTALFFGIFVLSAAWCFWTVEGKEAANTVTYGGSFMTSYPLDIYQGWLRRFVTFALPLAFVNYYPALYLLGRPDPLGLPGWTRLLSPLAAALVAGLAALAWQVGVRRYQSTGS